MRILLLLLPPLLLGSVALACNKAVCGSIVLKCRILKSCNCNLQEQPCTCCKQCFDCLSHLYSECCSCVEMCPSPNRNGSSASQLSYVEDLPDGIPQLFEALTEVEDLQERWQAVKYPIDIGLSKQAVNEILEGSSDLVPVTVNCTVVYLSQCMSWNKCKQSCSSMGAASYRWFHDTCCQCVGHNCLNYGINESRCSQCSVDYDEDDVSDLDYDDIQEELMELEEEVYPDEESNRVEEEEE